MTDLETTEIIQNIINKALEDDALPFNTIFYWSEFLYYHRWKLSTKLIIKILRHSADKLFRSYCQDVIAGISNIMKLLAYQKLLTVIAFYENDLNTVRAMLEDYDKYLGNFSNFIKALLGERREL